MGSLRSSLSTLEDGTTERSAGFSTSAIDTGYESIVGIHADWTEDTATLDGTITVEASNDKTTWFIITDSSGTDVTQTISGDGNYFFNISDVAWKWTRVTVAISGGDGFFTIIYSGKGNI